MTYVVARATAFDTSQKAVQCLLIWLVPVAGAAVVHWFAAHGVKPRPKTDAAHIPQQKNHYG